MEAPRSTSDTSRLAAVMGTGGGWRGRRQRSAAAEHSSAAADVRTRSNSDGETMLANAYGHEVADEMTAAARTVRANVKRRPGLAGSTRLIWYSYSGKQYLFDVLFYPGGDKVVMAAYVDDGQFKKHVLSSEERTNNTWIGEAIHGWFRSAGGGSFDYITIKYTDDGL